MVEMVGECGSNRLNLNRESCQAAAKINTQKLLNSGCTCTCMRTDDE